MEPLPAFYALNHILTKILQHIADTIIFKTQFLSALYFWCSILVFSVGKGVKWWFTIDLDKNYTLTICTRYKPVYSRVVVVDPNTVDGGWIELGLSL